MSDFFIGITLPREFEQEVESIRRRFHAPRTAPHVTVIPPFQWGQGDERLRQIMTQATRNLAPFQLAARGIGHFGSAVIFIDVLLSDQLLQCHDTVQKALEAADIKGIAEQRPYHPHITLATRLSRGLFNRYMEELAGYSPEVEFTCRQIALFKMYREGRARRWQVLTQLALQDRGELATNFGGVDLQG